jgi:predicted negative regulator of RcsB-dependent stress response
LNSMNKQAGKEPIDVSNEELDELKRDMRSAQLTAWAMANQKAIIAGLIAVVLLIVGVSLWKQHHDTQRASAASLYYQALNTRNEGDRRSLLKAVIKDYDNTVYGGLARLLLVPVDSGNAAQYLQELMNRSDVSRGIRTQARLDLAKLKLSAGDKAAVRELLAKPCDADYEQLRHYLLAQAADDTAGRIEQLKKAHDAISHDAVLSQRIEQQLSTLDTAAAGKG